MLEIKNITKGYIVNDAKNNVLKDISISFRKCEFVSILGPSGSGKTTLLNIISGLDSYDDGEIFINNKPTKKFSLSDWDNYRNHKIGFVFQNYNLIDHLSIVDNVKISLCLSGFDEKTASEKSINALKNVGLFEHINKKPNQLSGGQMQRVAIARAIVNNPDIIVADEPTGALDSSTSIEIMNILKMISNEKLVIMVTHNTSLAKKFSTRIINIEDGRIIKDTDPYDIIDSSIEENIKNNKKLSLKQSIKLSLYNLLTKKKRTILTSLASSIGIIGIALILSLTNGVNKYIKDVEASSINDYPIIINRKSYDSFGLINFNSKKCKQNKVCVTSEKNSSVVTNNIKDFKYYMDINENLKKYIKNITYSYDIELNVFNNGYKRINSDYFKELETEDYNILYGRMPKDYNEIVFVVDKNNYISKELLNSILDVNSKNNYSYNEIINNEFKLILNTDFYTKENEHYVDHTNDNEYIKNIFGNALNLKIVGIAKSEDESYSFIGYNDRLNRYLIDNISKSDIYNEQLNNKKINVITGQEFNDYDNTYEDLEKKLGVYELSSPSRISIYAKDFKSKENIVNLINDYNKKQSSSDKIVYQDLMKSIVDSISNILNIISYVLIGFTSISLIVSSIMISIITYISVLERTREIGILRAIGASKKDIKRIFNAETIITGLLSGFLGVIISLFIGFIINAVIYGILKVQNICMLSFNNFILLILISVLINYLSGLKSSIIASKKNIVDALRTE